MITFNAKLNFPTSNLSYDVQIWPLSFAPYLAQLFGPPCTDPSTLPLIQVSDVPVTCMLNFGISISLFEYRCRCGILLHSVDWLNDSLNDYLVSAIH